MDRTINEFYNFCTKGNIESVKKLLKNEQLDINKKK